MIKKSRGDASGFFLNKILMFILKKYNDFIKTKVLLKIIYTFRYNSIYQFNLQP